MGTALLCLLSSEVALAGSGLVALPFCGRPRLADRLAVGLITLGAVLGLVGAVLALLGPVPPLLDVGWPLPLGRFAVEIDALSAAFLLPMLVIPMLAAWYGLGYWPAAEKGSSASRVRVFLGILAAAMELLVVAKDGVLFLMAFEAVTLSAFFLVSAEDEREEARRAGWIYLVASHVSLMFLMSLFVLLNTFTGSFALRPIPSGLISSGGRSALLLLGLVGFGIKAGLMPFHVWLPGAHAAAPSHVSSVLSGVVLKTGIYGLARLTAILPDPALLWGIAFLFGGATSGVAGVAFAIGQHDLKRLLAYHSIENIGIIVMGLGMALLGRWGGRADLVALGFGCTVLHVWNHALFKSLLFLSAGSIVRSLGTRELEHMGGLGRTQPWSAGLFLLGAVAICGLPPLNGFVSEFYLYRGSIQALRHGAVELGVFVAPVLALIGALACACFIKVFATVFLGDARSTGASQARECPWSMRSSMLLLGGACILLGLAPGLAAPLLESATGAWAGVRDAAVFHVELPFTRITALMGASIALTCALVLALRTRAFRTKTAPLPTWDCGYAGRAGRARYTGSSLGATLVRWFAFLLLPSEQGSRPRGIFPGPSAYSGQVEDPVLMRLGYPLLNGLAERFVRLRGRQTGRIQGYILYVVGATLALLLFVLPALDLLRGLVNR